MDLLKDLGALVKNDREHRVEISVDDVGVEVILIYDPTDEYDESCKIPIRYDVFESFAYIPHTKYCEIFKPTDYGIDAHELELLASISRYLEEHCDEIKELCNTLSLNKKAR